MAEPLDQIQELLKVAARTERRAVATGHKGADPLFWALVPLYLLRHSRTSVGVGPVTPLPLSGGDVARFWARNGVWRSRGTVNGALRRHIGYASHLTRRPRLFHGWIITPNGVKYVEQAIASKAGRRG